MVVAPARNLRRDWGSCGGEGGAGQRGRRRGSCFSARVLLGARASLSLSLSLSHSGRGLEGLGWLWEQGRAGGSFEGQSGSRGMAHLFFARATLHNVHLSL